MRMGFTMRQAAIAALQSKVLRLNSASIASVSAGQVVNLASNDVRRFDDALPFWWVGAARVRAGWRAACQPSEPPANHLQLPTTLSANRLNRLNHLDNLPHAHPPTHRIFIWAGPLELLIVLILVALELGWAAAICGTAATLAVMPMQSLLVRRVGRLRAETAACTDERVRLTGEVIQVWYGGVGGSNAVRGPLRVWPVWPAMPLGLS